MNNVKPPVNPNSSSIILTIELSEYREKQVKKTQGTDIIYSH